MEDRRTAAKIALAALLIAVSVLGLSRLTIISLKTIIPRKVWNLRAAPVDASIRAVQNIREAARQAGPVSLLVGSSLSVGVEIRVAGMETYNVCIHGETPEAVAAIAENMSASFSKSRKKAEAVLVEFFPPSVSKRARITPSVINQKIQKLGVLYSWPELARHFLADPAEGAKILSVRLLGGFTPQMIGVMLKDTLFPEGRTTAEADGNKDVLKHELDFENSRWDLIDNEVDDGQINIFVNALKLMKSVSKKVYVYLPPMNVDLWQPSEKGRANVTRAIEAVRNSADDLITINSGDYSGEFGDVVHLDETGILKMSRTLSSELKSRVKL